MGVQASFFMYFSVCLLKYFKSYFVIVILPAGASNYLTFSIKQNMTGVILDPIWIGNGAILINSCQLTEDFLSHEICKYYFQFVHI